MSAPRRSSRRSSFCSPVPSAREAGAQPRRRRRSTSRSSSGRSEPTASTRSLTVLAAARPGRHGRGQTGGLDERRRLRRGHARPVSARRARCRSRGRAALRGADREAHPGRGGPRRRLARRGHGARARERAAREPLAAAELRRLAATLGADVPFFLHDGPQLGRGDGTALESLDLPQDYSVLLALPRGDERRRPRTCTQPSTPARGETGFEERRAALLDALERVRAADDLASLPPNDLASSPLATSSRTWAPSGPTSPAPARRSTASSRIGATRHARQPRSPTERRPG